MELRLMGKHHDRSRGEHAARALAYRSQRLEELLREELNSILDTEIGDPRLEGVRITRVELFAHGSRARVWFELLGRKACCPRSVEGALAGTRGFLRNRLFEALLLRRLPELRFHHDPLTISDPGEDESNVL